MNTYDVINTLILTEKATKLFSDFNVHTFLVSKRACKSDVAHAIKKIFDVKVKEVRIVNRKPKTTSFRRVAGKTVAVKIAYVALEKDEKLDYSKISAVSN